MPCAGNKRDLWLLTSFNINCYIVSSEHIDTMYIYILCIITHQKYICLKSDLLCYLSLAIKRLLGHLNGLKLPEVQLES